MIKNKILHTWRPSQHWLRSKLVWGQNCKRAILKGLNCILFCYGAKIATFWYL